MIPSARSTKRWHAEGSLVQLGRRTIPIPELLDVAMARYGYPNCDRALTASGRQSCGTH